MGKSLHFSQFLPLKGASELSILLRNLVLEQAEKEGLSFAEQEKLLMDLTESVTREAMEMLLQKVADDQGDMVVYEKKLLGRMPQQT
ncbi:MAG: hypothetical protein GY822_00610 [Deltaproteobacteria bacterium]|nr:hypothetical protein [Deltaproteobacteria bacterium]